MAMITERLVMYSMEELEAFFPSDRGWTVTERPASSFDIRPTVFDTRIKCIDRRFGATPNGYDPNTVLLSPAWLGAIDGIAAFFKGSAAQRMASAVRITESLGFKSADHGSYLRGDADCAFSMALMEGKFEGLEPLSVVERRILRKKLGIHNLELYETTNHAIGFLLNNEPYTTALPEDGLYYPIDIWFALMAGIPFEKSLPVVAKCGELILPPNSRNLFVAVH